MIQINRYIGHKLLKVIIEKPYHFDLKIYRFAIK
jgi:hypothetical protein